MCFHLYWFYDWDVPAAVAVWFLVVGFVGVGAVVFFSAFVHLLGGECFPGAVSEAGVYVLDVPEVFWVYV